MTTSAGFFRIGSTPPYLYSPIGLASDGAGGVYIADQRNSLIRRLYANGNLVVVAGNTSSGLPLDGVAIYGRLNQPSGVVGDGAGAVYIADSANNALRLVSASGVMTTLIGATGASGYAGALCVRGVYFLFECHAHASPAGDGGPGSSALLNAPASVLFMPGSGVWIADTGAS